MADAIRFQQVGISALHRGSHDDRVLSARAVFGFDVKRRASIVCLEGSVWVTGPGVGDQVLSRGESTSVSRRGRVVVEALQPARVRVTGS